MEASTGMVGKKGGRTKKGALRKGKMTLTSEFENFNVYKDGVAP
jgi:hypothetical protein